MSKPSSVKRRLDFGTSPCSLLCIPDLIPLDSPPQVPRAKVVPGTLTAPGKRRKFVAQQIDVLESAFDIDEYPTRERYEALALSLGVEVKKIQTWFKNARSKKRQLIRLQKIAHAEQELLQRWKRRAELRRYLNGTPAAANHPLQSDNSVHNRTDPDPFRVPNDMVLPEQIFEFSENDHTSQTVRRDFARTNLFNSQPVPLQTPNYVQATPAPSPWECYAPVEDLPPSLFGAKEQKTVPQSEGAFFSFALMKLFTPSDIFDNRMI